MYEKMIKFVHIYIHICISIYIYGYLGANVAERHQELLPFWFYTAGIPLAKNKRKTLNLFILFDNAKKQRENFEFIHIV